jgi:hypothetical protein
MKRIAPTRTLLYEALAQAGGSLVIIMAFFNLPLWLFLIAYSALVMSRKAPYILACTGALLDIFYLPFGFPWMIVVTLAIMILGRFSQEILL